MSLTLQGEEERLVAELIAIGDSVRGESYLKVGNKVTLSYTNI